MTDSLVDRARLTEEELGALEPVHWCACLGLSHPWLCHHEETCLCDCVCSGKTRHDIRRTGADAQLAKAMWSVIEWLEDEQRDVRYDWMGTGQVIKVLRKQMEKAGIKT